MDVKGIVHPKMKTWCLSAYPKGIPDDCFFSRTQTKIAVADNWCQSIVPTALREKKHTQTKPNETLQLVAIHWGLKTRNHSVQETEQYLYCFLPLIRHTVQVSWACSQQPARDTSSACFTADKHNTFIFGWTIPLKFNLRLS